MMNKDVLWQTKLHARLHDPAEKALVLMCDPGVSHGNGTVRELRKAVFGSPAHPDAPIRGFIKRADWWASSADRAQFPNDGAEDRRFPAWQQVRFTEKPYLVHAVSGQPYNIREYAGTLNDIGVPEIKAISEEHFRSLIQRRGDEVDHERTQLAFWRFGPELRPELDEGRLGALWSLLPADTRTPDHTIWQHLDLTSAFAGAFAADEQGQAALLAVSFGPVQEFIATGRSTSDLWAGSHFLSRVAWEGLKVICESLGPDAVLFPQLRGVPLVDTWLLNEKQLDSNLFEKEKWRTCRTDANPLFIAALPNKFVAVVPASQADILAHEIRERMRAFVLHTGRAALTRVLEEALKSDAHAPFDANDTTLPCFAQLTQQLQKFPEVHWSAVPFSLASGTDPDRADEAHVQSLLGHFYVDQDAPGFLGSAAWKAFRELSRDDDRRERAWFWEPRPGTLYPALHDLLERSLAANKSLRVFDGVSHEGYRCSISAEVEWLTTDRQQLTWTRRQCAENGTLWTRVASVRPAWCKPGEHLGALAMLKRLWPTLFLEEVEAATDLDRPQRFVVSSHALALSPSMEKWLKDPTNIDGDAARDIKASAERSPLPDKLARENIGREAFEVACRIPDYLDGAREADDRERKRREANVKALLKTSPETYYGLVLMDGDEMGKWLSGGHAPSYDQLFHPQIRATLDQRFGNEPSLNAYRQARRAPSPAYHGAISSALNAFALNLAQRVTERAYKGKLLYAGGDDLMALCASDDLPGLMASLRAAYSGAEHAYPETSQIVRCGGGHAVLGKRLIRLMGESATASMGAVLAHQMAPLGAVMRELRAAERRAKEEGGRNAFSLSLMKRSGGTQRLTAKWRYDDLHTLGVLCDLRSFLASDGVSRRAVYSSLEWLKDLPEPTDDGVMLQSLLAWQLTRQTNGPEAKPIAARLAEQVTRLALAERQRRAESPRLSRVPFSSLTFVRTFLSVAEFLAREPRMGGEQ